MAQRKLIWTRKAKVDYRRTLSFYFQRDGNKIYSSKIHKELSDLIIKLKEYKYLGRPTETENIRILIKGHFKIFYELKPKEIIILIVWDSRRNPEELEKFL